MTRIYTKAQTERRNALARARYAADLPKGRATVAALYQKHKQKRIAASRARYRKDLEASRAKARKWRLANPEKHLAGVRACVLKNPEKNKARMVLWRRENPEKQKLASLRWRKENPQKVKILARAYRAKHGKEPRFIVGKSIRTLMCLALRSSASSKGGRAWETLVRYSAEELKKHLELNFLPEMTWENRKLWHIDHIIPLASWDFDGPDHPEFKAAWALGNLRPVWAKRNLVKNKYLPTLEELQAHMVAGKKSWGTCR